MQHFMTRYLTIIAVLFQTLLFAQVKLSGNVSDEIAALPGVKIEISNSIFTNSDFDGNYQLNIPDKEKVNILFEYSVPWITIEIKNLKVKKLKESIIKVILPTFSIIDAKEYEILSEVEKQKFQLGSPMCYGQIKNYVSNEFNGQFVKVFVGNREMKIANFKFDSEKKRIVIEGSELETK